MIKTSCNHGNFSQQICLGRHKVCILKGRMIIFYNHGVIELEACPMTLGKNRAGRLYFLHLNQETRK